MKKLIFSSFLVLSLVFTSAATSETEKEPVTRTERVEMLVNRVNEIKKMDMSELSGKEKRALKKELKGIEKELKTEAGLGSPVTLSLGAVIIIVLLLILIL